MKVLVIIINILSGLGILSSIPFIIAGSQPCGGIDGCMIRIALVFGIVLLIVSGIVFAVTFKKSFRKDE